MKNTGTRQNMNVSYQSQQQYPEYGVKGQQ
jgi:hypothetical protein